ncbi:MAG: multidrug efflux system outer membrane protein [Flavobacterium sp.]|jgi:multidrug efflux system outer membrane protein
MKRQFIIKGILLVATMILMQSCFVAKEYEAPNVTTDNLFRTNSADTTSLAMLSWDQLFTDPILQEHIKQSLQNNLDLRIAIQNIASAEATMKQGKAGYLPSITGNLTYTHQELSKNSQFGAAFSSLENHEISVRLNWEADIWGKIRSNKRSTIAQYLQTNAAKQAIQTEIIATISSLYFQLLAIDAQIIVVKNTLENRNQSVEVIKALKDAGNVNEVAVKQTQAQKYATQIILKDLQYSRKITENAFSILLGKTSGPVNRSTFELQTIDVNVSAGLPVYLLSKRPDVLAAELNFRSTFEQTNVARSFFYPALTISATGGLQSLDLKEWFSTRSLFANVINGLTQPIFAQRQNKTRLEVAQANQQKAYLQYEKLILVAGNEVSNALATYENETDKLIIRNYQLTALTAAANYSDELLQYGLVNYLEVLTAKDNALNTEINYIDNKYKQMNAVIQLYKSLGGGN